METPSCAAAVNLASSSAPTLSANADVILHDVFGYNAFRGAQAQIGSHVISGGDALVLMPTGGGKSLCYQVPAIARHRSGFGLTALTALMHDPAFGALGMEDKKTEAKGGMPNHGLHHPAKATSVIFLYMDGGPSQVDTFDPKPMLDKYNGKDPGEFFKVEATQFNNNGKVPKKKT